MAEMTDERYARIVEEMQRALYDNIDKPTISVRELMLITFNLYVYVAADAAVGCIEEGGADADGLIAELRMVHEKLGEHLIEAVTAAIEEAGHADAGGHEN